MVEPLNDLALQGLRALRLWHWQQVKEQSELIARAPTTPVYLEACKLHTIHMQAVQFLNCVFPLGDTAEQDAGEPPRFDFNWRTGQPASTPAELEQWQNKQTKQQLNWDDHEQPPSDPA